TQLTDKQYGPAIKSSQISSEPETYFTRLLQPLLALAIQRWLPFRTRLETGLSPEILTRTFQDFALHKLVNAQGILVLVSGRKILKRWMNHQLVALAVIETTLGKGNHACPAHLGELAGRRHSRRLHAKKRHEQAHPGSQITVRRIPHHAALPQATDHQAHVIARNGNAGAVGFTSGSLQVVVDGIFVGAIHAIVIDKL